MWEVRSRLVELSTQPIVERMVLAGKALKLTSNNECLSEFILEQFRQSKARLSVALE